MTERLTIFDGGRFGCSPRSQKVQNQRCGLVKTTNIRQFFDQLGGHPENVSGSNNMTDEWKELTDEKLARIAQDDLQGQGAPVEAMRRLRVAIEKASAKSDTYSRRMLWLTVILALLTLVQVIPAIPVIKAWFIFIKAWFS